MATQCLLSNNVATNMTKNCLTGHHLLPNISTASPLTKNFTDNHHNIIDSCSSSSSNCLNENRFNPFNHRLVCGIDVTDNKTNERLQLMGPITMDDMNDEEYRLKTFDNWPLQFLDKRTLAKTGMFYTGENDKVKCYFCEVEIGRWEHSDEPVSEHLRWSPNCPLLRRRTTNNKTTSVEELESLLPQMGYDICGANDVPIDVRPNAYAEGTISHATNGCDEFGRTTTSTSTSTSTSSAATESYYPEFPEYAIETARLRSFADWPRHMKQKPEQLAEAGFFYIGVGDRVKCFSCGGGLKDWDDTDDPWEEHALWLNKCNYLKLMKGEGFIETVIANQKAKEAGGNQLLLCNNPENNDNETLTVVAAAAATIMSTSDKQTPNVKAQTIPNATTTTTTNNCDEIITTTTTMKATTATATTSTGQNKSLNIDNTANNGCVNVAEDAKMCKICYAAEYNTAFLPCGHVVACAKCASSVTKCPLCRKPFTNVMRVYFS